jgi:hypothetical protein
MGSAYDQYKKDGLYIVKGLLPLEAIQGTISCINKSVAAQVQACGGEAYGDIFKNLQTLLRIDVARYKKVVGAVWRMQAVYSLAHHSCIIGFLQQEFGWANLFVPGGQVVHIMAEELRIPNGYFGLVPHQDFPSVQASLNGAIVWLPLVNVDKDNYPMEVIPGSHVRGLAPMINHGSSTWEVDPSWYDARQFVPVEVDPGDVVLMSMFTIHRSSERGTPGRLRLAVSTRFDDGNEPTFVDRAYPSAFVRTVHREQYVKDFPSRELVEKTFAPC